MGRVQTVFLLEEILPRLSSIEFELTIPPSPRTAIFSSERNNMNVCAVSIERMAILPVQHNTSCGLNSIANSCH